MLALPIFTVRASYRHAVRNSPVDCCRHPVQLKKNLHPFRWRLVLALPIFTVSHPTTIVGARVLNFCVRDGNRWTHTAINTNYSIYIKAFQLR